MSTESRLEELRARTDGELVGYVTRELAAGIRLAQEPGRQSYQRAEGTYHEVARLLPVIHNLSEPQRRQLAANLQKLGELLQPAPAMTQTAR